MCKQLKRLDAILNLNIKYFHHPDFDKKKKIEEILSEIPNKDLLDRERNKVLQMRHGNKSPELRPCYEEPLLNREQEYHLFRKMNYYKYLSKKLIDKLNKQKPNIKMIREIEDLLQNYLNLRNQIANSNFRLASYVLNNGFKNYKKTHCDMSLSDAFLDVIKSVDYFNFTLGHKFSTYCIWVLRKNFFRGVKNRNMKDGNFISFEESYEEMIPSNENYDMEMDRRENAVYINKIIKSIKRKLRGKDIKRQIGIVESYYGLNGKKRRNLEEISVCLGITKERVRQLKEKFLSYMRETIKNNGKEYVV